MPRAEEPQARPLVPPFLRDLRLDRLSPVPVYYQLREVLRERLFDWGFRPGDLFPTEAEICRVTGLSRMTVRHALQELKAEGLLDGQRGAGTIVGPAAAREELSGGPGFRGERLGLRSFTEIFRAQGRRVGGRVLSRAMVDPPEGARRELGLGPGDKALEVRRLRYLDGEPVSLETSYFPDGPLAALLLRTDIADRSVYEVMGEAGVFPEEAVETVELSVATEYEAKVFGAQPGIPVALCRRTTTDATGRTIEFTKAIYRGDKHKFTTRLRREELAPGARLPRGR